MYSTNERSFLDPRVNSWILFFCYCIRRFLLDFFLVLPLIFISVGVIPLYYCLSFWFTVSCMFLLCLLFTPLFCICYLVVLSKIYVLYICVLFAPYFTCSLYSVYSSEEWFIWINWYFDDDGALYLNELSDWSVSVAIGVAPPIIPLSWVPISGLFVVL